VREPRGVPAPAADGSTGEVERAGAGPAEAAGPAPGPATPPTATTAAAPRQAAGPAPARTGVGAVIRDFLRRVYNKAAGDNIFFMAGAIAFNVLVAIVPLILAVLGVAGLVLRGRYADPAGTLMSYTV